MAVKIIRQPKKIVLIGAPTSAGGHSAGHEEAPAALRRAGLAARLEQLGFEVSDDGDTPARVFQADEESPRARNVRATVAALEALQPHIEKGVKSGALPVVLGGDCTIALATLAAIRRYYKEVSLIYCDSDADLNTPATTPSGYLAGMVVAHIAGQGAPELVRFFNEPPLVREPDIALFGLNRLDPPEEKWLESSPMRRFSPEEIREQGPAAAAEAALQRIHTFNRQWVLHLDVDVLHADEMPAVEFPSQGLRGDEMRQALEVFLAHPNLAAVEVTSFVPSRDTDDAAARKVVELLAAGFAARHAALAAQQAAANAPGSATEGAQAEAASASAEGGEDAGAKEKEKESVDSAQNE